MVNYNSDSPKERGYWYDAIITRKVGGKTVPGLDNGWSLYLIVVWSK